MKTFVVALVSILGLAACASDVEEPVAEQSEALSIGGGTTSGGLGSWCQCKLDCDNTYGSNWRLVRLCKAQCDKTDSKCTNVVGTTLAR